MIKYFNWKQVPQGGVQITKFDPESNTRLKDLPSLLEDKCCNCVRDFNYLDIDLQGPTAGPHGRYFFGGVQNYFLYQQVETPA